MLRDFARFLFAVWIEWKVLLTGGSIIALLVITGTIRNKPLPSTVNWLVLGVTLIVAAFLAWRKEWVQNGEGLVDVTPEQITKLVREVTDVAAKSKLKPYHNKRMRVTAILYEVSHFAFPMSYVRLHYGKKFGIGITMQLPRWRAEPFVPLPRGTIVTVIGRISFVGPFEMRLANAELISVEVPPASTPDQQSPPPSQE